MILKREVTKTHYIFKLGFFKLKLKKPYNSKIYIVDQNGNKSIVKKVKGLNVKFEGDNASLLLHLPIINFKNSKILIGSNSIVEIKSSHRNANNLNILATANNVKCFIDEDFSCHDRVDILLDKENGTNVLIGKNCMFASYILIRTSDSHVIIDKDSKKILNYGKDVIIGNHVWIARNVALLKGAQVADNSVVGAFSVVTKPLTEENAIYVGSPAKKVKSNIDWYRSSIPKYQDAIENGVIPV